MRRWIVSAPCTLVLLTSGCVESHKVIRLQKNLSGEASVVLVVDKNQLAQSYANATHCDAVTARKAIEREVRRIEKEALKETKKSLERTLPDGVDLRRLEIRDQGDRIEVEVEYAFESLSALAGVELDLSDWGVFARQNPESRPFRGLEFTETDERFIFQMPAAAEPVEDESETGLVLGGTSLELWHPFRVEWTNGEDRNPLRWKFQFADTTDTLAVRAQTNMSARLKKKR